MTGTPLSANMFHRVTHEARQRAGGGQTTRSAGAICERRRPWRFVPAVVGGV